MKDLFKTLFAICLIVGTLASCEETDTPEPVDPTNPTNPDSTQLVTPQPQIINVEESSFDVFWPEVENAVHYMVRMNGGEASECESTSIGFTDLEPGDYTIEVQAVAEEDSDYLNSEWGQASVTLVAQEVSNSFDLVISDLTAISATVTCTPTNLEALYFFNTCLKADYDIYATDEEFVQACIDGWKGECIDLGITLEEGLASISSVGVDVWRPSGFHPETEYIAYAFGITPQGEVTTPLTVVPFTTLALPAGNMIEVFDIQETSFGIKINAEGYNWICSVADKGVFSPYEGKEANYLVSFGAVGYGNYTYTPENLSALYNQSIRADAEYVVLAAFCNEKGGGLGPITRVDVKTLAPPSVNGSATIEVTNIQDFFADVTITPSEGIDHYRVLVTKKDGLYGTITTNATALGMTPEEACIYFIHDLNYAQKDYTGTYTLKDTDYGTYMNGQCEWASNTEYWIGVVLYDKEGGRTYMEEFFKTLPLQN